MSWFKWHIGTCDDPKFQVVALKSRVTIRDVIAVWAVMLECASQADDRGSIEDMDREAVTLRLQMELDQFEAIHTAMQGRLLDGNRLKNFDKRQAVSDPTAAERKRRQREKQRSDGSVTESNGVTNRDTPSRHTDREIEEKERSEENLYTGDFESCWAEYPKRSGSNDKKAAFRAYGARLKEGHKPDVILAGVKRYAAWCRHTGKVNTETVQQAATFFGTADPPNFTLDWRAPGQAAPSESKPMACDESLQPYADRLIAAFGVPYFNSWFARCIVVEKEDWITLAAPTAWMAKQIEKDCLAKLKRDDLFGSQFQVGHGRPKAEA